MRYRCRLMILSALLVLAAFFGCRPTPTPPPCVVSSPRERPAGWKCGPAGESTECYDGSQCTLDVCQVDGTCVNPVRSGDCDAGEGWHGVCGADGACCPRPASSIGVSASVPLDAKPVALSAPVDAPR